MSPTEGTEIDHPLCSGDPGSSLLLAIAAARRGFMKNLLGCEMEFLAVRASWRGLIGALEIAAPGRLAGLPKPLRYTSSEIL